MSGKKNKKLYYLFCLIPATIGLTLLIAGIVNLVNARGMFVPSMGDSGWFDSETAKNAKEFAGIGMIIGGVFVGVFVTLIVFAIIHSVVNPFGNELKNVNSLGQRINSALSSLGVNTNQKQEDVFCEYCGSRISSKEVKCPNCGATVTRTKKKNSGVDLSDN